MCVCVHVCVCVCVFETFLANSVMILNSSEYLLNVYCLLLIYFLQPINFKSYLDVFPFPFYLLLKEIRSMPAVLGDALQQWFQLVNDGHYLGLTQ